MNWLNLIIKYRPWLALVFLALGILVNTQAGFWPAFILYLIAAILIAGHFLFGPMRLIQTHMEAGDIEGAKKVVNSIKYPNLLIKPMRSVYYTLKGHLAMAEQDFDAAERHMKQSDALSGGQLTKAAEGPNKLQLGVLAMQKGNIKEAENYIRAAIKAGLPDNENNAAAYLQLSSIMMQRREFKAAKSYFAKAESFKPKTPQLVDQINQVKKYLSRMPG